MFSQYTELTIEALELERLLFTNNITIGEYVVKSTLITMRLAELRVIEQCK